MRPRHVDRRTWCVVAAARLSCAPSSAAPSLWLRLVRCNVVRCALSAARSLPHVVPMHQCIPFHSACLVHGMVCVASAAARFPLPVAVLHGACGTSSAARRMCSCASRVFGCFGFRRCANPRMIAPPRALRCHGMSGWLRVATQVAPLSVVRCTPPAWAESTHARTRVPHAVSVWRRRRRPGRRKRSLPRGASPPARMALPPASPPRTDLLAVGVWQAA